MSLAALRTAAWEVQYGKGDRALFQERARADQYAAASHGVRRELVDREEAEAVHLAAMEALRAELT